MYEMIGSIHELLASIFVTSDSGSMLGEALTSTRTDFGIFMRVVAAILAKVSARQFSTRDIYSTSTP